MPRRLPSDSRSVPRAPGAERDPANDGGDPAPGTEGHDRAMMARAIDLASSVHPHPNPRVGAVVVTPQGTVVGEGAHRAPGEPHAEVVALGEAGPAAVGAALYVTLEPCAHHGRTPPCVDAVVAAGIARVVVGAADPDPVAAGGRRILETAGIEVSRGVLAGPAAAVDPGYFHHRITGRPRVTLKLAATLDGQVAAADGTSRWITGDAARADAHRLRAVSDAVMVGAGTLHTDDPRLDARPDPGTGHQPRPVVVAGERSLPPRRAIYTRHPLVYATRRHPVPEGAELAEVGSGLDGDGWVDLAAVVKDLGNRGVVDLLVEGGPTLARSLLVEGLVDRVVWYVAGSLGVGTGRPALAGTFRTVTEAIPLRIVETSPVGGDLRIVAEPGTVPEGRADGRGGLMGGEG